MRDTVRGVNDDPSVLLLVAAAALVSALIALVGWLVATEHAAVTRRAASLADLPGQGGTSHRADPAAPAAGRPARSAFGRERPQPSRRAAVVINPSKFDNTGPVIRRVNDVCRRAGWEEPLWLETTIEEPGTAQAKAALEAGCEVVCALGGDGTVRAVATALVDTGVPMGLLPAGTGNLLARNLSIPVDQLASAMRVALGGRNSRMDTCELTMTRPAPPQNDGSDDSGDAAADADGDGSTGAGAGETTEKHIYLVIAGLGFDAEVMADVEDGLKDKVGWVAYLVAGARHLRGGRFRVEVKTDEGWRTRRRVRSVLVGNVGKLQGGVMLLPDAKVDDGVLDVLLLAPEGMVGWGAVAARVLTRQRRGHHRVDHRTAREIEVRVNRPVAIQLDGDSLGEASAMSVKVRPSSLVIRRPITSMTGR